MKALWQRFVDWKHEIKVRRLAGEYVRTLASNKPCLARVIGREYHEAINARSDAQVARMEAKLLAIMDPHERAAVRGETRA